MWALRCNFSLNLSNYSVWVQSKLFGHDFHIMQYVIWLLWHKYCSLYCTSEMNREIENFLFSFVENWESPFLTKVFSCLNFGAKMSVWILYIIAFYLYVCKIAIFSFHKMTYYTRYMDFTLCSRLSIWAQE